MSRVNSQLRLLYNWFLRNKNRTLDQQHIVLIASNCNGACILHDLGIQFNSPFVNLWIGPEGFLKLCENLEYYMAQPLVFINEDAVDYPIANLGDIKIHFQHYSSAKKASECWERRKNRMGLLPAGNRQPNEFYYLFTDRDGCTEEDLKRFDALPYPNKKVFTHIPHPEIVSSHYISGFELDGQVGQCMEFRNRWTWKKYYDSFDYVKWLQKK